MSVLLTNPAYGANFAHNVLDAAPTLGMALPLLQAVVDHALGLPIEASVAAGAGGGGEAASLSCDDQLSITRTEVGG